MAGRPGKPGAMIANGNDLNGASRILVRLTSIVLRTFDEFETIV
jgi:hypothetical protein